MKKKNFESSIQKALDAALSGQLSQAVILIEREYRRRSDLKDGFAMLGSICLDKGRQDKALLLYERDRILDRLSPPYRHILAYLLAITERPKAALVEISRVVAEDPTLIYGFMLVDRKSGNALFPEHALKEKIERHDCVSYPCLNYKHLLSPTHSEPFKEVDQFLIGMYSKNAAMKDGYAFIGSIHRAFARYEQALYCYETDRRLGRITPLSRLILANLLARIRRIEEAEIEVKCAYAEDESIRDGFAIIGVVYRYMGRYNEALNYYEKDWNLNRLSSANRHIFADLLARSGKVAEAELEVEIGYGETPVLSNGYARIGSVLRAGKDFSSAFKWYERDRRENRLSPIHRLVFAELLARDGKFTNAVEEVDIAYTEDSSLTDGYSRCAWIYYWPLKNISELIHWMEKDYASVKNKLTGKNSKNAFLDINNCRISPQWVINLAQAYAANKEIEKALKLVEQAYQAETILVDGYSRCAWQYYWPREEYERVIYYFELDKSNGRLSSAWQLNLAQAYAANNEIEKALLLVEQMYQTDASLTDGYARCAWQYYWPRKQYEIIINYFEIEKRGNRLSSAWQLNLAQAYAAIDEVETAMDLVDQAYRLNPALKDGYARCAWQCFWLKGNYSKTVEWICFDEQQGRLSSNYRLHYAQVLAAMGKIERAKNEVEIAYRFSPDAADGYTRIMTASTNDLLLDFDDPFVPKHIFQFLESDSKSNRLTNHGRRLALPVLRKHTIIASEIAQAEERYRMDLSVQWNQLALMAHCEEKKTKRVSILNAEMEFFQVKDLLIQFREIVLHEQYRFETSEKEPLIIDGGADVGMAILYFKWLYPQCRILAFEPNPMMYRICKANIWHNRWDNVEALPYALSDRDADSRFYINDSMPMASRLECCMLDNGVEENGRVVMVPGRRLSSYINNAVHFLKLDVEGMECRIMEEISSSLDYVQGGFIEYHYDHCLKNNSLAEIIKLIETSGFICRIVDQPNRALEKLYYSAPYSSDKRWSSGIFFTTP